jgi:hypothetical protein
LCEIIEFGDGTRAFVCGGRHAKPRPCAYCGKPSEILCDAPRSGGATCDLPCCRAHSTNIGPDRDLCLDHWRQAEACKDMNLPASRDEIRAAGWTFIEQRPCRRCQTILEFWKTPEGKTHALEVRPEIDRKLDTHFRHCPHAAELRKQTGKAPRPPANERQGALFK